MITQGDADRLRDELLTILNEDAHNGERLMTRLDRVTRETGVGAEAALLLILTRLPFEDEDARRHWVAILGHREQMSESLGREVGVRLAILDYFMNVNRHLVQPTLIDLEMFDSIGDDARKDTLTGLSTDRAMRSALQNELRRARRYRQKAALVVLDLDDFGEANERLGELVGDRLLREAAILLSNKIRDIDAACRLGEDEFALLLPETDRNGAYIVAERFRRELEAFFLERESGGRPVRLTASLGLACYPDDATTPEALMQCAARALYEAKAFGKNLVQAYHPERRRYLRFELEPGRFEIEVLAPEARAGGKARDLSRNGLLFTSPEPLAVGEEIEIRVLDADAAAGTGSLRIRGRVVRLEELPPGAESRGPSDLIEDRYDIGVAFDLDWSEGTDDLLDFLERAQGRRLGQRP